MVDLTDKIILVTGRKGFIGRAVCDVLRGRQSIIPHYPEHFDFRKPSHCNILFEMYPIDYVIHLAANSGGIAYNKLHGRDMLMDNLKIGVNLIEAAHNHKVKKFINVTSSCSYPDGLSVLKEEDYWKGLPNKTVEYFGLAKRMTETICRAHNEEGASPAYFTVCLTNCYGPFDTFNPKRAKAVSSLIRKIVEAKQKNSPSVEFWGTGLPLRELIYVEDAAECIVRSLEKYNEPNLPLNLGVGYDISIADLVKTICQIVDYRGQINWDRNRPDGQIKKLLDVNRMEEILEYRPPTYLHEGLRKTIEWYVDNKEVADKKL